MPLAVGLMSGTSCDGVSAALAEFSGRRFQVRAFRTDPYPAPVRRLLHRATELTTPQLAQLNVLLGALFAASADALLTRARVDRTEVAVIGSHGHTVYHGPADPIPCTLQLGDPHVIAERTTIPVIADFRSRDVAAGGQGAPLVPFFDEHFFGQGAPKALQNIGGIGNVTVVGRGIAPLAFDTGPGNCLIDLVARRITAGRQSFDSGGGLARRGRVDEAALRTLLAHPYFYKRPPKSTGPEVFNESLLVQVWGRRWIAHGFDVLATVTAFTAHAIADSYHRFVPRQPREVIVSGGGVYNRTLMAHLMRLLAPARVRSSIEYGLHPQAKESVAFAFLALRALRGRVNHLPRTTGARHRCPLGVFVRGAVG